VQFSAGTGKDKDYSLVLPSDVLLAKTALPHIHWQVQQQLHPSVDKRPKKEGNTFVICTKDSTWQFPAYFYNHYFSMYFG